MDWTAIATAPISMARNPYFGLGDFKLRIEEVVMKESRKKELFFIVEFTVLESTCGQNQNGSKASWLCKMNNEPAMGNVKQLMIAVLGLDPTRDAQKIATEVDPALPSIMQEVTAEPKKLAGSMVHCTTQLITTKAGRPFTRHDFAAWSPPAGWSPRPAPAYVPPSQPVQPAAPPAPGFAPAPAFTYPGAPPGYAPQPAPPQPPPGYAPPQPPGYPPGYAPPQPPGYPPGYAPLPTYAGPPGPYAAPAPQGSVLDRLRNGNGNGR